MIWLERKIESWLLADLIGEKLLWATSAPFSSILTNQFSVLHNLVNVVSSDLQIFFLLFFF